jgi:hypothetical protein
MARRQAPGAEAARRAARRRVRLVQRQLALITELEGTVEDLTLSSPLAAWFAPAISDRLHRADLFTVAQLVDRIRSVPRRWWSGLPGIGEGKGQRMRRFIEAHLGPIAAASAAPALPAPGAAAAGTALATAAPARKELAVVPLERCAIAAPPLLCGTDLGQHKESGRHRTVPLCDGLVHERAGYLAAHGLPAEIKRVPPGAYFIGTVEDLHLKLPAPRDWLWWTPPTPGDSVRAQVIHRDL